MPEQGPNLTPDFIPPAPEGQSQIPPLPVEAQQMIEVPDFMKPATPEAPESAETPEVDAAKRVIDAGDIPDYTAPNTVPQVEFKAPPSREPIEVPMPPDPRRVPGWDEGIVRRP